MPLPAELVGRTYRLAEPYAVSREKVREFADAIGDPCPAYRDPVAAAELGYADVVAPPTFPVVVLFRLLTQLFADPEVPITLERTIHADQRIGSARPVVAGDRLTARLAIDDLRAVAGSDRISTSCVVTAADGSPVCELAATFVHRAVAG